MRAVTAPTHLHVQPETAGGRSPVRRWGDDDVAAALRDALQDALEGPERPLRRLSKAGTGVTFYLAGDDRPVATLLCDRYPPQLEHDGPPAEVDLTLTAVQMRDLAAGRLRLPALVMSGEVGCGGPVRRFLRVAPILRALLEGASGKPDFLNAA